LEEPVFKKGNTLSEGALAKNGALIPSENIAVFESDRYSAHYWVSRKVAGDFQDACRISGRKSCDVIEPMMEAYTKIVKNKVLKKVEICPFKTVEVHIGTLKIEQKYAKRGRKENRRIPRDCPKGGIVMRKFCLDFCPPMDSVGCWINARFRGAE